jgi:hypothetical protein
MPRGIKRAAVSSSVIGQIREQVRTAQAALQKQIRDKERI